jgi:hypothetical protein
MLNKNKASKLTWDLFEVAKETVKKNFVSATNNGLLKLDQNTLPEIFSLLDASLNEGFNKGHNNFIKSLSNLAEKEETQEKKK